MLDFVLSKMTWLITSILVMSFIVGFYQIQVDTIDENMLQSATQEVDRVIKRLDGINGEMNVNFTFDRYYSYRAFYLPGKVGGDIYKFEFYESYIRGTSLSGDIDISLRFGTNIQPLQMNGTETNVELEKLLDDPANSYVKKLTVYSNQDFGIASRLIDEGLPNEHYKVFVFMFTDTIYDSGIDDGGKQLIYGDSKAPSISNATSDPNPQEVNNDVNITVDVGGDHINRVFYSIEDPDGDKNTITMSQGSGTEYYNEINCTIIGDHSYKIWAQDVFGRIVFTDWQTFNIKDSQPPVLYNARINTDILESGDSAIFYVGASDNAEVKSVHINITTPDAVINNYVMANIGSDEWSFNIDLITPGSYSYVFSAEDTSGNWETSSISTFKIQDTTAPVISSFGASPVSQAVNKTVYFTASVSDIVGVSSVTIKFVGSTTVTHLTHTSGDSWSIDRTFSIAGRFYYDIVAIDASGNASPVANSSVLISN